MATAHKLYAGCTGLALIMMAMAAPMVDASLFQFFDNPLFLCHNSLAYGESTDSVSWAGCCGGLAYAGQRFSSPGTKTMDQVLGCLCYKSYLSELPGYNFNYTQNALKHCKASFPWEVSASVDYFKAFNFKS